MVRAVESHFRPNSKSNCAPSSSARHSFGSNGAFLNFAVHVTKDITRSLKSMIAIASNSDCSRTISHAGSGVNTNHVDARASCRAIVWCSRFVCRVRQKSCFCKLCCKTSSRASGGGSDQTWSCRKCHIFYLWQPPLRSTETCRGPRLRRRC